MNRNLGFDFTKVFHNSTLDDVYRLRYKVYVDEWGFECPEDHPSGVEIDEFDQHAMHFIAIRYGQLIGTARLIQYSEKGFPLERHCTITSDLSGIDRRKIAEISRLAICKEYCKRAEDKILFLPGIRKEDIVGIDTMPGSRRKRHEILIGLFKVMYVESIHYGLTHWYAVMTRALRHLISKLGMDFSPIGPPVDYHGERIPCILSIEEGEKTLAERNPEVFKEYITAASE